MKVKIVLEVQSETNFYQLFNAKYSFECFEQLYFQLIFVPVRPLLKICFSSYWYKFPIFEDNPGYRKTLVNFSLILAYEQIFDTKFYRKLI